jgi:AraC-like DNA-binding protein
MLSIMMPDTFTFNSERIDSHAQPEPWQRFLDRFGWERKPSATAMPVASRGHCLSMPGGFELIGLEMSGHAIATDGHVRSNAYWLGLVLDGQGIVRDNERAIELHAGQLFYGFAGSGFAIEADTSLHLQLVRLPHALPVPHGPSIHWPWGVNRLSGASASATLLAALLRTTSASMDAITRDQVRPLELAISEFFISCVASCAGLGASLSSSTYRKTLLRRACAMIEQRLRENTANAATLARDLSVSPRYLQKLFAETGETLSVYVRRRRLECAYKTLIDPLHSSESISEICYHWGFNDAAYFSRAFRMHFSMAPSEHRHAWTRREQASPKLDPAMTP